MEAWRRNPGSPLHSCRTSLCITLTKNFRKSAMDEIIDPWYSPDWFTPSTLRAFTWSNELLLWLVAVIPLFFIIRWATRYYLNQKLPVALVKSDLTSTPFTLIRLLPDILLSAVA